MISGIKNNDCICLIFISRNITQRLQNIIYVHLSTDCFMNTSLQSTVLFDLHWALYHVWFQNKSELYLEILEMLEVSVFTSVITNIVFDKSTVNTIQTPCI